MDCDIVNMMQYNGNPTAIRSELLDVVEFIWLAGRRDSDLSD